MWLGGSRGGTVWYDGQGFRLLPGTEGYLTWAMTETRAGALILGCTQAREVNAIRLLAYDGHELRCLYEATVNGWVRDLVETTDGDLWFALCPYGGQAPGDGLGRLRPDGEVRFYTTADGLADDHVEAVLVDHQGRIWAGTYQGLSCYDGKSFVTYTTDDGLPNDRVRCLYEDRKRRLWLGTDSGVCQYDRQTFQTIRAPQVVGVNQIRQDRAGRYWFAGAHGVVQYTAGLVPPRVRLLGVLADDTYAPEGIVEVPVSSGQVIFEYQAMSFRTPLSGMRYTCRLHGFEVEWQPPTGRRRAVYGALAAGQYTFEVRAIDQDLSYSEPAAVRLAVVEEGSADQPTGELIGSSTAMRRVRRALLQAAGGDLPVLLLGETGCGKGLAADTVHRHGPRRTRQMLYLNCGAMHPALVENELFGHDKGAYTGAVSHQRGRLERAAGGTLFLDEIAELPLEAQAKLLHVLDGRGFERVGGDRVLNADVWIIAATNRDLAQLTGEGRFREDLYRRLAGYTIELPPLRARPEDIPELAVHFVQQIVGQHRPAPRVSRAAMALLQAHDWRPGNVGDLFYEMKRVVRVCGDEVRPEHLTLRHPQAPAPAEAQPVTLAESERRCILHALERSGWVVKGPRGAAAALGIPVSTLRDRIRKMGLTRPKN